MGRFAYKPNSWFPLTPRRYLTGFVAIVNKELSAKYETLVNDAPELIKELPWGKDYEVDVFRKPDFTALEIVSFCTGGTIIFNPFQERQLTH